jgi:hypothetical protein
MTTIAGPARMPTPATPRDGAIRAIRHRPEQPWQWLAMLNASAACLPFTRGVPWRNRRPYGEVN